MKFQGRPQHRHGDAPLAAVVLVNLGTPDQPTTAAVRRYLAEFLADPRVIELPRLLWRIALHGVILRLRPRRSAHAYQAIWQSRGSPLLFHTQDLAAAVQAALHAQGLARVQVHAAMRYGNPALRAVLAVLMQRNLRRLLVLPLYPQYSGTTTGSVFDALVDTLKRWRWVPDTAFVSDYYADDGYAELLADHIHAQRGAETSAHLLFSFHGIPERYVRAGDPYYCQCLATARRTAAHLGLDADRWSIAFQSRVGRERWVTPYTDHELAALPKRGITAVDVVCPAFAVDCLETLEEIAIAGRATFLAAGGKAFRYLSALNAEPAHAAWLAQRIAARIAHWPESSSARIAAVDADIAASAERHRHAAASFGQDAP